MQKQYYQKQKIKQNISLGIVRSSSDLLKDQIQDQIHISPETAKAILKKAQTPRSSDSSSSAPTSASHYIDHYIVSYMDNLRPEIYCYDADDSNIGTIAFGQDGTTPSADAIQGPGEVITINYPISQFGNIMNLLGYTEWIISFTHSWSVRWSNL